MPSGGLERKLKLNLGILVSLVLLLVEQLISFITRYNYELDKQPVVVNLKKGGGVTPKKLMRNHKSRKCRIIFSVRIFKFYNNFFSIDPMIPIRSRPDIRSGPVRSGIRLILTRSGLVRFYL